MPPRVLRSYSSRCDTAKGCGSLARLSPMLRLCIALAIRAMAAHTAMAQPEISIHDTSRPERPRSTGTLRARSITATACRAARCRRSGPQRRVGRYARDSRDVSVLPSPSLDLTRRARYSTHWRRAQTIRRPGTSPFLRSSRCGRRNCLHRALCADRGHLSRAQGLSAAGHRRSRPPAMASHRPRSMTSTSPAPLKHAELVRGEARPGRALPPRQARRRGRRRRCSSLTPPVPPRNHVMSDRFMEIRQAMARRRDAMPVPPLKTLSKR